MRWALCTDDIYYAHPVLKNIFSAGRTMPIKRTRGMEQPLFKVSGATSADLTRGLKRRIGALPASCQERLHGCEGQGLNCLK